VDKKMVLSNVGVLADVFWHEIPHHAKHIRLDAFVVMPNHLHGILILEGNDAENVGNVGQGHALALRVRGDDNDEKSPDEKRFQNIGKNSISSIIGSYKSAVTKHANRMGFESGWQVRFNDRVIRDEQSFIRIQNYILTNVENWEKDCFFDE
jgi:REP element-mobilizing transposase RayT